MAISLENINVTQCLEDADQAWRHLNRLPPKRISALMHQIASEIENSADEIVETCHAETALPVSPRLQGELARTITVLRSFGDLVLSGGVANVQIVTSQPDRQPSPRPDLRLRRMGIGPVVVIEASNFPLAFGAAGGDTASALAARCPVILKVHPVHVKTSQLIGDCITRASRILDLPSGVFQILPGEADVATALVSHPLTRGVAFTGSKVAGNAILQQCARRGRPLDELSLEMGSVNPVFVLDHALANNHQDIAKRLADSILMGSGQFCTCPGIIFVHQSNGLEPFRSAFAEIIAAGGQMEMLAEPVAHNYRQRCEAVTAIPGVTQLTPNELERSPRDVIPALFEADQATFAKNESLREEVFGPASLLVTCDSFQEMAELFEGELTASIHASDADLADCSGLVDTLSQRVGRLLFNGVPTGVEVCDALNHGGPWPAAYGRYTVVGLASVERWLRPICFQDVPDALLPLELRTDGPGRFVRRIDGQSVSS